MDISFRRGGHEFNFYLLLKHNFGGVVGSHRRSFYVSLQFYWKTRTRGAGVHSPFRHVVHVLLAVQTEHLLEAMIVSRSLAFIEAISRAANQPVDLNTRG
jgi:hypothetical protein